MNTKPVIPVGTQRAAVSRRETNPFSLLQQEIDRLFEGVARNIPGIPGFATTTMPSMDISETDKVIEITAELPGLEKKDVELNLAENLLTIRGEKKNEREEKKKRSDLPDLRDANVVASTDCLGPVHAWPGL